MVEQCSRGDPGDEVGRQRRCTKEREPFAIASGEVERIKRGGSERRRRIGPGRRKRDARKRLLRDFFGPVNHEKRSESHHVGQREQDNHAQLQSPRVVTGALFEVRRSASAAAECLGFDERGNQVSNENGEGIREHEQFGTDVKQHRAVDLDQRTYGAGGKRSHRMSTEDSSMQEDPGTVA